MDEAFLTPFWTDVLTLSGAVGVILTAVGVALAWWQMRKTTAANEAATQAAIGALDENRRRYNKHVISQSSHFLSEAVLHVRNESWELACMRLRDVANLLIQMATDDGQWGEMADQLRRMENSFAHISKGQNVLTKSLQGKWANLSREVQSKIALHFGPFATDRETMP